MSNFGGFVTLGISLVLVVIVFWGLWHTIKNDNEESKRQAERAAKTYRYGFRPNPFERLFYFEVEADSQEKADVIAQEHMTKLFNEGRTVMTHFYPVVKN